MIQRRLAVLALLAFLLAGCVSAPTPEPVTLTIEMTEYAFSPDAIELQVGQEVTFILENSGHLPHEFMIGRDVHREGLTPSGYEVDFWHTAGVMPQHTGGGELMQHTDDHGQMPPADAGHAEHDMGAMTSPESEMPMMVYVSNGSEPATLTFTVTKEMVGDWEIGCFELNGVHYTAGMVGTLTVVP